jgi:hypothetical protein
MGNNRLKLILIIGYHSSKDKQKETLKKQSKNENKN